MDNQQPKITEKLVSVSEVADRFGVSERAIWRWVEAKELPAPLRLGVRHLRWLERTVEVYIQDAAIVAESQSENQTA